MRKILTFLLLLGALTASGQLSSFRMVSNGIPSWATVNDSTFSATVTWQADLTANGFIPTGIADTMYLFSQYGERYRIDSVANKTFSTADLWVVESGGDWGTPTGQVMVHTLSANLAVPNVPFGTTGATAVMQASVDTYNASLIGGALDLGSYLTAAQTRSEISDSIGVIPTIFNGGTFSSTSTLNLLENATPSYSARYLAGDGSYMGWISDTANAFVGLRMQTLQGVHDFGFNAGGMRIKSGYDMNFVLSNTLRRYYFTHDAIPVNDTISYLLAVNPSTGALSRRAVSSIGVDSTIFTGGTLSSGTDFIGTVIAGPDPANTQADFAIGTFPSFPNIVRNGTETGLFLSPNYFGGVGLILSDGSGKETQLLLDYTNASMTAEGLTYSAGIELDGAGGYTKYQGTTVAGAYNYRFYGGTGSPEGVITAPIGSIYSRTGDGTPGATLYIKESGVSNTGWTALGVGDGNGIISALPSGAVTINSANNLSINHTSGASFSLNNTPSIYAADGGTGMDLRSGEVNFYTNNGATLGIWDTIFFWYNTSGDHLMQLDGNGLNISFDAGASNSFRMQGLLSDSTWVLTTPNQVYKFPNAAGTDGQVLALDFATQALEWVDNAGAGTAQTIDTFSIAGDTISISLSSDAQPAQTVVTGFSRTVASVTPATDSTITAIDLQSKYVGVFQIDCTTCSTTKTIVFSAPTNPVDGGVYTWHFQNTTATNSINLPATFLDETGAALDGGTTYDLTADKWFTCYYDGTNYYCK